MEFPPDHSNGTERRRVGLVYDERMCKHSAPKREIHPENPDHIRAVGTNSRLLEFLKGHFLYTLNITKLVLVLFVVIDIVETIVLYYFVMY
ncbi:putative histone deacetylase [Helianthus annuus]|nr:putative histone deacetylase [Helianthus annuus]